MKTILINGSPRKNWNTAALLKEAQKGAISVGAQAEYIDLYDLSYTGLLPCCDTLQVKDYSRFSMAGFDEAHKKAMRETQFPLDLDKAFRMGARLAGSR